MTDNFSPIFHVYVPHCCGYHAAPGLLLLSFFFSSFLLTLIILNVENGAREVRKASTQGNYCLMHLFYHARLELASSTHLLNKWINMGYV